jgi:hypothetical protein
VIVNLTKRSTGTPGEKWFNIEDNLGAAQWRLGFQEAIYAVADARERGANAIVHCMHGVRQTGTCLALLFACGDWRRGVRDGWELFAVTRKIKRIQSHRDLYKESWDAAWNYLQDYADDVDGGPSLLRGGHAEDEEPGWPEGDREGHGGGGPLGDVGGRPGGSPEGGSLEEVPKEELAEAQKGPGPRPGPRFGRIWTWAPPGRPGRTWT